MTTHTFEPSAAQLDLFNQSWTRAWAALGLAVPAATVYEHVLEAYGEPQRHYHTLQHLSEAFAGLAPVLAHCQQPGAVELAMWFHDAVYDPKAKDNEKKSASWASRVLREQGASAEVIALVQQFIMDTQHHAQPQLPDAQILVDVDLSILAASAERFAEYEQQVRAEYSWVPQFLYSYKRREILQTFLERESIFSTDYFRERIEAAARRNLTEALAR